MFPLFIENWNVFQKSQKQNVLWKFIKIKFPHFVSLLQNLIQSSQGIYGE